MPTSTPWRGRESDTIDPLNSPIRPSVDSFERLSPAPPTTPYNSNHNSARHRVREQPLIGLGLSDQSDLNNPFAIAQPDHLYIDQDGGAHIGSKVRSATRYSESSNIYKRDGRSSEARLHRSTSKQNRTKNHTRSGSTIDDLANVAIANSPTFDNGSPRFTFGGSPSRVTGSRPATSYIDGYSNDDRSQERPFKRVRSEKLHQIEWSPRNGRPRTSHALQPQSSMEDAELLLGLRNGYSFSTNTSPVFASASTFQPSAPVDLVQIPVAEPLPVPQQLGHMEKDNNIPLDATISDNSSSLQRPEQEIHNFPDKMELDPPASEAPDTSRDIVAVPVIEGRDHVATLLETKIDTNGIIPQSTAEASTGTTAKKPRKIKPEIQAEVCAACQKLQRDTKDENSTTQWISCDYCRKWFHLACGGFKDQSETRAVDKFVCKDCEPEHGQTTFVRKSSRVRTAIDYAGLNQGVVKSSEESSMHHYIQPIKDGTIKYLPDSFARIRPELLTAGFWENMDNMKRPFVVPACWNPRFGVSLDPEADKQDALDAVPITQPSTMIFDSHGKQIKDIPSSSRTSTRFAEPQATSQETVMECDQDYLDMVMPRNLTVRKVAELYGPEQPVPVIDVKSQETKGQWSLNDWAEYYEQQGEKPIRNVISLEVSNSPIGKLIRRPKAVRDIDLEDYVWDNDSRTSSNKRPVQFYCLMSVADSYTDFHIDFGGSSVYYHILKGVKTFFFIPPEDKNLREYEKWCNSDTQNDTWLGDLCNGNVTRVDLHEGDTAFIPAGWIHSVWTPEDSLVIGGNFLTRLDYDLQLRVANIEKTTKVPQKFRYPFFQKVMWFALLKYLEEDPVPEEVLRDFHSDEDYRFLRANPIWHEFGELANDAEPGEPDYNARLYPKSELGGLPALRDYLYRTACIYADIPVPDINKKQIDAVKASIPKTHGDPMRLIKTFAVWCAWKTGNEAVPKWVHDQGDGLNTEIREREKAKEETFRVPPERVSARNASRAKAASPAAAELLATPAKPTPNQDGNDSASVKSRSGSRGGSQRVACDACRKRRIKCRHKDGEDAAANSSPPEIRPRTYSNVSVDIPKLASASPVNSVFDQGLTSNGAMSDFSTTSDLAQAALATLHSQSSEPGQAAPVTASSSSAKKGRSKACEECRKSKRRCVHDEFGRIDPAKAAEPSKPRGSTSTKRQSRTSDEYSTKRLKTESETDGIVPDFPNTSDIDMMIDPALMEPQFSINAIHAPTESIVTQNDVDSETRELSFPPLPALSQHEEVPVVDNTAPISEDEEAGSIEPPKIEPKTNLHIATDDNAATGLSNLPAHMRWSPEVDTSYSPITVDGNVAESTEKSDIKFEDNDASQPRPTHASHPLAQVDRSAPSEPPTSEVGPKVERVPRASSSSERTLGTSVKSRRSSSNTSGMTHRVATTNAMQQESGEASVRPVSRGSSTDSDIDADEKFARELQAAENGLRRRASMRA